MLFNLAGFLLLLLIILTLWTAVRLIRSPGWFRAWMRGNLALAMIACVLFVGLISLDLISYTLLRHEVAVADVHIRALGSQQFEIDLRRSDSQRESAAETYPIRGDMWQLDCKLLIWSGLAEWFGLKPSFRLDRLSGRYFTLEQETGAERTVHSLAGSASVLDLWSLAQDRSWLPLIRARQGSSVYLPLQNGAEFRVLMRASGMVAEPLNDAARQAMFSWR
jgi:hypothetical protein